MSLPRRAARAARSVWTREPVMTLACVECGLALLFAFGVPLTKEQAGGITACAAAALGLVARSRVTPHDRRRRRQ